MPFQNPDFAIFSARATQSTLRYLHASVIAPLPASRPSERRLCRACVAPLAHPPPPQTSPPPSPSSPSTPWTGAPRRSVFPYDARGEFASCWWGWGAGPQGSPAGLERVRRGRPCGARSRVPSDGRGGAGRPRGITLRRRAALLRPAVPRVQVRGGRPPGEGARGEGGRAGMSAGECGSAAETGEKLRERGARRVIKSNFDCMCRLVGRTDRRLVREARGTAWGSSAGGGSTRTCAALAAGRGGDRAGPGKREGCVRGSGTQQSAGAEARAGARARARAGRA